MWQARRPIRGAAADGAAARIRSQEEEPPAAGAWDKFPYLHSKAFPVTPRADLVDVAGAQCRGIFRLQCGPVTRCSLVFGLRITAARTTPNFQMGSGMVSEKLNAGATGVKPIRRALLSVTDKTGLVEFARALKGFGVELVSTGGTAKALRDAGLVVKDISDLTGFPEMLDGRVKTLHPRVHGGLLYIRGNAAHEAAVAEHGIEPIDMVVVNLYAFEKTAAQPGVAFGHLIENIDIGGPSMVRSAAKNFEDVAIVTRASDYPELLEEMKAPSGAALSRPRAGGWQSRLSR